MQSNVLELKTNANEHLLKGTTSKKYMLWHINLSLQD